MNIRDIEYSRHFLVLSDGVHFPHSALQLAAQLARGSEKGLALVSLNDQPDPAFDARAEQFGAACGAPFGQWRVQGGIDDVIDLTERTETPILLIETTPKGGFSKPMRFFKGLRELRIPFILVKAGAEIHPLDKVVVPVGYLVEEREKAPYTSNMGRFLHSEIILLEANDYGSKTPRNIQEMTALYDKFNLRYQVVKARKDSFKVEREACQKAGELQAGLAVFSTSRDYGLDDLLFGPKELDAYLRCPVPAMFINPRKDLYVLCW